MQGLLSVNVIHHCLVYCILSVCPLGLREVGNKIKFKMKHLDSADTKYSKVKLCMKNFTAIDFLERKKHDFHREGMNECY